MNPQANSSPQARNRPLYALLILVVIATGLLWRSRVLPLPPFTFKFGGDALWALVVFLGFGFLLRYASTLRVALIALAASCCVEVFQLYHAPWIEGIRTTVFGRLVLGSTFNWPDLLAYAFGIVAGALAEHRFVGRTCGHRSDLRT